MVICGILLVRREILLARHACCNVYNDKRIWSPTANRLPSPSNSTPTLYTSMTALRSFFVRFNICCPLLLCRACQVFGFCAFLFCLPATFLRHLAVQIRLITPTFSIRLALVAVPPIMLFKIVCCCGFSLCFIFAASGSERVQYLTFNVLRFRSSSRFTDFDVRRYTEITNCSVY